MRTFSIAASLAVFALLTGVTLKNQPVATALAQAQEFHQPSIAIDRLTTDAKYLPDQTFDTF